MEPSATRRAILSAATIASVTTLAGCSDDGSSKQLAHEVEVFNYEDVAHDISVTVSEDGGEVLYQREFHLDGEHGFEGAEPFLGSPTTIAVAVDGSTPSEHPWPEPNCEERGVRSAGGAQINLMREEGLRIVPNCDTEYVE